MNVGNYREKDMVKGEFLEILRSQLSGQMQEDKVAAHVRYYQDYIEAQVRGGRPEAEVLRELGDPRLIAKTLLDTDTGEAVYQEYQSYTENQENENTSKSHRKLDLSTWYGRVIVIVLAALVIIGLLVVIGTILPFVIVGGLVLYLFSKFRKSR